MKNLRRSFVLAIISILPLPAVAAGERAGMAIVTAAEFVQAYPERTRRLLQALDLDRAGLERVRDGVRRNDPVAACEALLRYYRQAPNGGWLKARTGVHDPGGFDDGVLALAEATLADDYLLQGVRGTVARTPGGSIDWADRGPNDDLQWTLFINRHFVLIGLQKAYHENRKTEYIQYINEFIQDWIGNNYPPAEGASDRDLPANWRPMSTASRLLQVWPQLFYYLQGEPAFSPATRLMMLSSVPEQAEHLQRYHRRKHNHAVKEMAGLGHAAAAWPEFRRSGEWYTYSLAVLSDEIRAQVYPSGVQKELASHYHRTVLEYVAQYAAFSTTAGKTLPDEFLQLVESMVDYLARTMTPDGHVILNNDSDRDYVREKILAWADVFEREDWRYVASYGERGAPPGGPASRHFGYAGQLLSRSDWSRDAHWSYFDLGPWGVSHQHNDKLHLSLSVGQRNFLVDTGRVYYIADDPIRQYVLGSAAHNTVLIDGRGQGPRQPERRTPATGEAAVHADFDVAIGRYEDGYPGTDGDAVHTRAVLYVRNGYWIVVDRVETDRPRNVRVLWHFHPDTTPELRGPDTLTTDSGVANLRIHPVGGDDWRRDIVKGQREPTVRGWYSPVYNTLLPAPTVSYETDIDGTASFAWLLTVADGDVPEPAVALKRRDRAGIAFDYAGSVYEFELDDGPRITRDGRRLFPIP